MGDPDRALIPRFHTASIPPRGVNVMRYSNPKVDELLDKAATVYDQTERLKLYEEAQKLMMADAPVVWINQVVELRAKKKTIQGIRNAADYRILFDKAWWRASAPSRPRAATESRVSTLPTPTERR